MTAAPLVDAYLVDVLLPEIYPSGITILRGSPGTTTTADVVSLQSTSVADVQVQMGPQRRHDETMTVTLLLSCFRSGNYRAQQVADETAWTMLAALRDGLRFDRTPNMAGAVRHAVVSSYSLAREDDPAVLAKGRVAVITVTLTIKARN